MAPRYRIGQKVIITPANERPLSPRDSHLERYVGQRGKIADYYWISLDRGIKILYTYTVRIEDSQQELVLHEDELQPYID